MDRNSRVEYSYVRGKIKSIGSSATGGIAGYNNDNSSVVCCYNNANIEGNRIGGIVGENTGIIENCYNVGELITIGKGGNRIGGIAGYSSGSIINCYNTGKIHNEGEITNGIIWIGGVVGNLRNGNIENCINYAGILINSATGWELNIGGIVGNNDGFDDQNIILRNVYNLGNLSVTGVSIREDRGQVGGIVGNYTATNLNNFKIISCYNAGEILYTPIFSGSFIGKLVGENYIESGDINSNFCLNNIKPIGNMDSEQSIIGISQISKDEMNSKIENVKEILGENFKEDTNNINNGYPILFWQ